MVGWTSRNRRRDREWARAEGAFRRWWAGATDEEKNAWRARQAERDRRDRWLYLLLLVPLVWVVGVVALAQYNLNAAVPPVEWDKASSILVGGAATNASRTTRPRAECRETRSPVTLQVRPLPSFREGDEWHMR